MPTTLKWKASPTTGSDDLKPLRVEGRHAEPLGAAYYAEHDFSAADLDANDNKRKVLVPNLMPVSVGLGFQFANLSSRNALKFYGTMFLNPPHHKVANFSDGEYAIWIAFEVESYLELERNGRIFFPHEGIESSRGFVSGQRPFANFLVEADAAETGKMVVFAK